MRTHSCCYSTKHDTTNQCTKGNDEGLLRNVQALSHVLSDKKSIAQCPCFCSLHVVQPCASNEWFFLQSGITCEALSVEDVKAPCVCVC